MSRHCGIWSEDSKDAACATESGRGAVTRARDCRLRFAEAGRIGGSQVLGRVRLGDVDVHGFGRLLGDTTLGRIQEQFDAVDKVDEGRADLWVGVPTVQHDLVSELTNSGEQRSHEQPTRCSCGSHVFWTVLGLAQTSTCCQVVAHVEDVDVGVRRHSARHQFPHEHAETPHVRLRGEDILLQRLERHPLDGHLAALLLHVRAEVLLVEEVTCQPEVGHLHAVELVDPE